MKKIIFLAGLLLAALGVPGLAQAHEPSALTKSSPTVPGQDFENEAKLMPEASPKMNTSRPTAQYQAYVTNMEEEADQRTAGIIAFSMFAGFCALGLCVLGKS